MIVVVSDNGASGEGGPNGSVNEMKFANGVPDDLAQNLAMIDELGGTKTYNHYPNGWAMAFNTPFKMWKRYEFNGGTSDPCIISWPAGTKARGEIRDQYHHAIDIVPTILDVLGVEPPETIKGHTQSPLDGVSMRESLDDGSVESKRKTQFYAMLGSRSIWHEGWKAVTTHPSIAGWGNFNDDEWELYHTDVDRAEVHNLAAEQPDKLRELVNVWFSEAGANGAFPLDDRTPVEIMTTPRPQLTAPRNRYVYFPGTAPVSEWQAVNTKNRSFVIGALVDIPAPGAAGRALRDRVPLRRPRPLRQGQPPALRQQLRRRRGADDRRHRGHPDRREPDPLGLVREGRDGADVRHRNAVALPRRHEGRRGQDQDPARRRSRSPGTGLFVGRHSGEPVTDDYPGEAPYAFTGGTINRIAVDVSGEPYVDLERQAEMLLRSRSERASTCRPGTTRRRACAIVDFVERVTTEGGPDYVPPAERIAVSTTTARSGARSRCRSSSASSSCGSPRWRSRTSRCATKQPWQAAYEKDYAWLGGAINKHYHGDDGDLAVLMGGIAPGVRRPERRALLERRRRVPARPASTRRSAARSTSAATCR